MWGCIGFKPARIILKGVPSLYVRVYRLHSEHPYRARRSLIICEGVSEMAYSWHSSVMFPHYMWGCIVPFITGQWRAVVPSLYVRVYRGQTLTEYQARRSLTIREGVSRTDANRVPGTTFPHYTWGCITPSDSRKNRGGVPSLYVSVYRTADILYRLFFYFSIHTKKYLIFQHIKYK